MTSQQTTATVVTLEVMTWQMETTLSVKAMRVTAGSPRQQTNGQTTEDLTELHKVWIDGEAPVAAMVKWLWSWAVITEISGSILSLS